MYWEEPYKKLGLQPLDDFLRQQHRANLSRDIGLSFGNDYKQIGSTTWMCACAAYCIYNSHNADLVTSQARDTKSEASRLLDITEEMVERLQPIVAPRLPRQIKSMTEVRFRNGILLRALTKTDMAKHLFGNAAMMFDEDTWKARAIRRLHGPFAMVRNIRWKVNSPQSDFPAYAEDEEYLFTLTQLGAWNLSTFDPSIQLTGFTFKEGLLVDDNDPEGVRVPF